MCKKSWIVFHTRCGNFVSKKKMTYQEAEEIWRTSTIFNSYEAFSLVHGENFIIGITTSEDWTYINAEEYAKHEEIERYERLRLRVFNERKEKQNV